MQPRMSEEERDKLRQLRKLRANFRHFARNNLKIRAKNEKTVAFKMNEAQRYVHSRLEEQKREKGWVRALILKGRQQGMSTYVGGRFYHRASMRRGVNVFIMAHDKDGSDNLFKIVERYHVNNPMRPHTGASNTKELEFDRLDSSYAVGTAGQKAGGRGKSISLYHGSEVAFWPNAKEHFKASVQAVPMEKGTEIILESTANGPGGEFYSRWQDAEAGRGDYIAIFVPWFWSAEYTREVPAGFELSTEQDEDGDLSELEYMEAYDLTLEQMVWRRAKIIELGSASAFKQEYPATANEAFQATSENSFIKPVLITRARKRHHIEGAGPLIVGVDPAGAGGDRFAIAWRRGHKVLKVDWRDDIETVDGYQWCRDILVNDMPSRMFIDAGGIGNDLLSLLRTEGEPWFKKIVRGVNFGAPSEFKKASPHMPGPLRRTDEMWDRFRQWLELEEGVSLPDNVFKGEVNVGNAIQSDFTHRQLKRSLTNDTVLETKREMRDRGVRSPDLADAIALTFASTSHIKDVSPVKKAAKFGDDRSVERALTERNSFDDYDQGGGPNSWMAL